MRKRVIAGLTLWAVCHFSMAADIGCTMTPAPIDFARIARHPAIKSYTVDSNKLGVTALLKNGRALRLVHMGCAHFGAEAALWFHSETPFPEVKKWLEEAVTLAKMAFSPSISKEIERSLKGGMYGIDVTETRLVITSNPSDYFNFTVLAEPEGARVVLSILYSIGG